jgi:hypothetical protein
MVLDCGLSDHFPICVNLGGRSANNAHHTIKYRSCTAFDEQGFLTDLQYVPWHVTETFEDPNDAIGAWLNLFLDVVNHHAPLREKRVKHAKFPDWWSTEISDALRLRDSTNKAEDPELFRSRRNHATSEIRKAKQDFYIAILDKGRAPVHAFWKHFRELLPSKNQASPLELHFQNSVLNSPFEISNAFNEHFASIADAIIANSQSHGNDFTKLTDFINSKVPHDLSFDIPEFSEDYVCDSLRKLNVKKRYRS